MTQSETRRTGRPPKVSAQTILDAAALLPAEELTLTALAAALEISVKTVYYYFPNRAALLRALSTRSLAELQPPDLSSCDDWQEALRRTGRWIFRTMRSQPPWALQDAGSTATVLNHVFAPCLRVLRREGFTDGDALEALILISNFASGMAASAQNVERVGGLAPSNVREWMRRVDEEGSEEAIADLISSRPLDGWFEAALELAIVGAAQARPR